PVMKATFPLVAQDVALLLSKLGADVPTLARDAYTLRELVDEVVGPSGSLLAVQVHKHREHYTLNGCMAEVTELRTGSGSTRTIVDRAEVTRLGEGLEESGRLQDEPVRRTLEAIEGMIDQARADGAASIAAVGTAGLRIAANPEALVDAVRERSGVGIEVITG